MSGIGVHVENCIYRYLYICVYICVHADRGFKMRAIVMLYMYSSKRKDMFYMYTCVNSFIYLYTDIHMPVCMRMSSYESVRIYKRINSYTYTSSLIYTYKCMFGFYL